MTKDLFSTVPGRHRQAVACFKEDKFLEYRNDEKEMKPLMSIRKNVMLIPGYREKRKGIDSK